LAKQKGATAGKHRSRRRGEERRGEEWSRELGKKVKMLLAKKTAINLPYKQIEQ
jgi:hypothetical protein